MGRSNKVDGDSVMITGIIVFMMCSNQVQSERFTNEGIGVVIREEFQL